MDFMADKAFGSDEPILVSDSTVSPHSGVVEVISPAVLRLETEQPLSLGIGIEGLVGAVTLSQRDAGIEGVGQFLAGPVHGVVVVRHVEDLEPESVGF